MGISIGAFFHIIIWILTSKLKSWIQDYIFVNNEGDVSKGCPPRGVLPQKLIVSEFGIPIGAFFILTSNSNFKSWFQDCIYVKMLGGGEDALRLTPGG